MRKLFCLIVAIATLLVSAKPVAAQSQYALITAANIADLSGNKLAKGTITFTPLYSAFVSAAPHLAGGGRGLPSPITCQIVGGATVGTCKLADVTQANPSGFCYADVVHDSNSGNSWALDTCVQPAYNASWCTVTGGVTTCSLDNYVPPGTPGALVVAGPNLLNTSTSTPLTGLLMGNGTNVAVAQAGVNYQAPLGYVPLNPANELADVPSPSAALTNLGAAAQTSLAAEITRAETAELSNATALSGSANDATARSSAAAAQTTANTASTNASSALSGSADDATARASAAAAQAAIPAASSAAPAMDGTAAAGVSTAYARADHVHPTDASRVSVAVPPLLQYLGNGADGSCIVGTMCNGSSASTLTLTGDFNWTALTVPFGTTLNVASASYAVGLTGHVLGACNISGLIEAGTLGTASSSQTGFYGGSSGGPGGGTSAATAGATSYTVAAHSGNGNNWPSYTGGAAGAANGGNGSNGISGSCGNGQCTYQSIQRAALMSGGGQDFQWFTGAYGPQGANSGGLGGTGANHVALICGSITYDGTHVGTIDSSGGYGAPSAANSTGAGPGGGGGVVILSSQAPVTQWPNVYVAGGPGGLNTVPDVVAVGGSCTSPPKATLGVSSGAFSGTCTVVQAGAGCGTGAGITWDFLGGGGTAGTAVMNPTWSSGALASCTVTPGTSSGYSAATTYTLSGNGGDGLYGWYAEFQNW